MRTFLISLALFMLSQGTTQQGIVNVPKPSGGGGAAPTFVEADSATTGGTTCTVPSHTYTSGNTVYAASGSSDAPETLSTPVDSNITWTAFSGNPYEDGANLSTTSGWRGVVNTTHTGTITLGISPNNNQGGCAVIQYTPSNVIDAGPTNAFWSSTPMNGGTTGTTSQANEVVVGIFAGNLEQGTASWTAVSSFVIETHAELGAAADGFGMAIVDKTVSSTGTQQAKTSYPGGVVFAGAGITFTIK